MTGSLNGARSAMTVPAVGGPSGMPVTNHHCGQSVVLSNSEDYDNIENCTQFFGDISIDPDFVTAYASTQLLLNGLQTLDGSLDLTDGGSKLTQITFADLRSITGTLNLSGLTTTICLFPSLTTIGTLHIEKTGLGDLGHLGVGPAAGIETISTMIVKDNPSMTSIGLPVETLVDQLTIQNNQVANLLNPDASTFATVSFPNLTYAGNVVIDTIHEFDAPILQNIGGNFVFTNTNFNALDLPRLSSVQSDFNLTTSYGLVTLNLPSLQSIGERFNGGDLVLQSNQFLTNITLPELNIVYGGVNIVGNVDIVSMPKLTSVVKTMVITADISAAATDALSITSTLLDCSSFLASITAQMPDEIICDTSTATAKPTTVLVTTDSAGMLTTMTSSSSPTASATTSPKATHRNSSSGLSTGAKAGIGIAAALVFLAALVLLLLVLRRRSNTRKSQTLSQLDRDQSKQLDYSPMIGSSSVGVAGDQRGPGYQDAVAPPNGGARYSEIPVNVERETRDEGMLGAEEGRRPISPISVVSELRRSFGSRSVSPESVHRVPLGDGGGR